MTEDSAKARGIIAVLLLVSLVALNVALLVFTPIDDFTKAQLNTLNGALILQLGITFAYYFGSSSGAKTLSQASIETNKTLVQSAVSGTGSGNALTNAAPTGTAADPVTVKAAPALKPDPEFIKFQEMVRTLNPAATDVDVARAWAGLKNMPDVVLQ